MDNIKFIKTYRCPSAAAQIGAKHCEGKLLYHSVDDAKFIPHAIDLSIDLHNSQCGYKDIVNARYTEDDNYSGRTFPIDFWLAHYHPPLRLAGIPGHYRLALHFIVNTQYFLELGGLDCGYEYLNFNLHDFVFRVQADGGKILDSPTDVTNCNHYGNRAVDHGAIEDAYPADHGRFIGKYGNPNALRDNPVKIDIDNWMNTDEYWPRRFGQKIWTSYEEMIGAK
jgi:hypothetical protein